MKKLWMNLQFFADGGEGGSGGQGGNAGTQSGGQGGNSGGQATYSYEQAEEIANARAQRAEQSALRSYFQQQGMTQEQITQAISDFKEKQRASQPNIAQMQADLDAANAKNQQYENEKILSGKGVKPEDLDYVTFKVNKMVTDKKDFKTAADEFLKENPKFLANGGYKMSTGVTSGSAASGTETKNESINNMIRNAFRR